MAELFRLLESDVEDRPLLARTRIDLARDLEVNERYTVRGEVTGIVRKHGAALGDFDLATCVFEVRDRRGDLVATVTNVYAIGRDT